MWSSLLNLGHNLSQTIIKFPYVTFDIFDTLVVRKCRNPHDIFDIVEKTYNHSHENRISGFRKIRIDNEIKARSISKFEEITLTEIYEQISTEVSIETAEELKKIEIDTEIEQCIARNLVVEKYKQQINSKNVFIISDMYLPKEVIVEILNKNKIPLPKKIYLSSECKTTKRTGGLFKLFLHENHVNPRCVLHIGDNFVSDYIMPKLCGCSSFIVSKNININD